MKDIKHLFELSKIAYTESELEEMSEKMDDIILLMDKIKEADSLSGIGLEKSDEYARLRKDIPEDNFSDGLMLNVKGTEKKYFSVPKVV